MKTIVFTFLTALLAMNASSQITKADAETFIKSHSPKDVQRVTVITFTGYKKSKFTRNGELFDAATTTITALDNSIHIVDGTGKEVYIPYTKIKALVFQPENKNKYSMIRVDL